MEPLELLYDHYKETFSLSKEAQNRRNKNFLILCILEAISFWVLVQSEKVFELFTSGISAALKTTISLSNTIIQTLLWIVIIYILIRYIQDVLYVERQYGYLSVLERQISDVKEIKIFKRESDNYVSNYPIVLNLIDLFYKTFMPIFFTSINSIRIYKEWMYTDQLSLALICDTFIFIAIFIITCFYFFEIHSKTTDLLKKKLPLIAWIAKKLRKLLKNI